MFKLGKIIWIDCLVSTFAGKWFNFFIKPSLSYLGFFHLFFSPGFWIPNFSLCHGLSYPCHSCPRQEILCHMSFSVINFTSIWVESTVNIWTQSDSKYMIKKESIESNYYTNISRFYISWNLISACLNC